jgi:hypothetical protein
LTAAVFAASVPGSLLHLTDLSGPGKKFHGEKITVNIQINKGLSLAAKVGYSPLVSSGYPELAAIIKAGDKIMMKRT